MAIISDKGLKSLKKLYLVLTPEERQAFLEKHKDILDKTAFDLSRNIGKEKQLQEDINQLMKDKIPQLKEDDYYIFDGEYGENLVYFLDKIKKLPEEKLKQEAESPDIFVTIDRLRQPGRHKLLYFAVVACSLIYGLSALAPYVAALAVLAPIAPYLLAAAIGLTIITGICFYSFSSDRTTHLITPRENIVTTKSMDVINKYLTPKPTQTQPQNESSPEIPSQPEPLVSINTQQRDEVPPHDVIVEARGGGGPRNS